MARRGHPGPPRDVRRDGDPDPAGEARSATPKLSIAAVGSRPHGLERLCSPSSSAGACCLLHRRQPHPARLPLGIQLVPTDDYAAFIFLAALGLHLVLRPRSSGAPFGSGASWRPPGTGPAVYRAEPPREGTTAAVGPAAADAPAPRSAGDGRRGILVSCRQRSRSAGHSAAPLLALWAARSNPDPTVPGGPPRGGRRHHLRQGRPDDGGFAYAMPAPSSSTRTERPAMDQHTDRF